MSKENMNQFNKVMWENHVIYHEAGHAVVALSMGRSFKPNAIEINKDCGHVYDQDNLDLEKLEYENQELF